MPTAKAESRGPGLRMCRQHLCCAKFSLFRSSVCGGTGVRRARARLAGPPRARLESPRLGPTHLQRRVGSDEVPGGLRQPHSPPLHQQRHRGGGRRGRPREAVASPAAGSSPPPPSDRPAAGAAGKCGPRRRHSPKRLRNSREEPQGPMGRIVQTREVRS